MIKLKPWTCTEPERNFIPPEWSLRKDFHRSTTLIYYHAGLGIHYYLKARRNGFFFDIRRNMGGLIATIIDRYDEQISSARVKVWK